MEREILFRGKLFDGEWIEGVPVSNDTITCIFKLTDGVSELKGFQVNPSTVGQYTGLTDKNGVKIFEGGYCKDKEVWKDCWASNVNDYDIFLVKYEPAMFRLKNHNRGFNLVDDGYSKLEVIGNIHDNPEMLKGDLKNE